MSFSTTSYLAGVGSVIAALTIGFSGGFFLANPTPYVEQNRLQRVTSNLPIASPAPQAAALGKPAVTEAKVTSEPAPTAIPQPAPRDTVPVMAKAVESESSPVIAKSEPARAAAEPETGANLNAERLRAADAKALERKRKEARRFAERRRQREIALATVAVRRMLRDRDPQQVADSVETPRFGFFGQE